MFMFLVHNIDLTLYHVTSVLISSQSTSLAPLFTTKLHPIITIDHHIITIDHHIITIDHPIITIDGWNAISDVMVIDFVCSG